MRFSPGALSDEKAYKRRVPTGGMAETADGSYDADGGYDADEGIVSEGPESDEEMPLADHIEEMVYRLGIVIVVMAIVSGIVFPFAEQIINFLWYSVLPGGDIARPRVYHPLALILARLKVATLAGFVVALPVFVYQS
jgi:sec-independent protein translocase protein TatC